MSVAAFILIIIGTMAGSGGSGVTSASQQEYSSEASCLNARDYVLHNLKPGYGGVLAVCMPK